MAETKLEFFLRSIGYPDRAPDGSASFTLRVDDREMSVEESAGRIVLSCALTDDDSLLPMLAAYASGRMLREDAALAYGKGAAFLWQAVPADADAFAMRRRFEDFCDSCDWWRERIASGVGEDGGAPHLSEMTIRP